MCPGGGFLGYSTINSNTDFNGHMVGNAAALPIDGQVSALEFYVASGSGQVRGAIYADTGSGPGALLAQAGPISVGPGSQTLPIGPVDLPPATYWLFIQNTAGLALGINSSGGSLYDQPMAFGPFPATASAAYSAPWSVALLAVVCPVATPTPTATPSPSPSVSPTPSASPSVSVSPSATPSPTGTATSTLIASATASATPCACSPTPTPSATDAATATGTPASSPTATATAGPPSATTSPTATPSSISTASASATPPSSLTASPSATPAASSTASPGASATMSGTGTPGATATVMATATATPNPAGSMTPTPLAGAVTPSPTQTGTVGPAPDGPLWVLAAYPVPNPDPDKVALKMSVGADDVVLRLWTPALVLVGEQHSGPVPAGWSDVVLDPAIMARVPRGLGYLTLQALRGQRRSAPKPPLRFVRLR